MSEWSQALAGLSPDEIKRALESCRQDEEWPPSIAMFLKLARPEQAPYHKPFQRALPRPPAKPQVVNAEIQKMREALR